MTFLQWLFPRRARNERKPERTVKIGLISNQGNLRICTFDIFDVGNVRMTVDRLEAYEGVQIGIPVAKVNEAEQILMQLTVEELAKAIAGCDQS